MHDHGSCCWWSCHCSDKLRQNRRHHVLSAHELVLCLFCSQPMSESAFLVHLPLCKGQSTASAIPSREPRGPSVALPPKPTPLSSGGSSSKPVDPRPSFVPMQPLPQPAAVSLLSQPPVVFSAANLLAAPPIIDPSVLAVTSPKVLGEPMKRSRVCLLGLDGAQSTCAPHEPATPVPTPPSPANHKRSKRTLPHSSSPDPESSEGQHAQDCTVCPSSA